MSIKHSCEGEKQSVPIHQHNVAEVPGASLELHVQVNIADN